MTAKAVEKLSFEEAMTELETLVQALENGQIPLADAMEKYARGTALRQHCQKQLDDAKLKIEALAEKDGVVVATVFEEE